MDEILRRTILTRHNSQRNVLALGGGDDFKRPSATDMATMVNASIKLKDSKCPNFSIMLYSFIDYMKLAMG